MQSCQSASQTLLYVVTTPQHLVLTNNSLFFLAKQVDMNAVN